MGQILPNGDPKSSAVVPRQVLLALLRSLSGIKMAVEQGIAAKAEHMASEGLAAAKESTKRLRTA